MFWPVGLHQSHDVKYDIMMSCMISCMTFQPLGLHENHDVIHYIMALMMASDECLPAKMSANYNITMYRIH